MALVTAHVALTAAHAAASPVLWYVTRMLGVSAYITLLLSVVLGMLRAIARQLREPINWIVQELHQTLATLAAILVVGHLVALVLDPFLPFSLLNILVPGVEPYRPLAVNLGVVSLYAMALTLFSTWVRRRLSYGVWRTLHYFGLVAFLGVTAHGWLAGSDSAEPWMRALYIGGGMAVGFLALARLFAGSGASAASQRSL